MKKDLLYVGAIIAGAVLYAKLRDTGMKPLSGLGRGFRFPARMLAMRGNPILAQSAFRFFRGAPTPFRSAFFRRR